jgi:Peptidase family M23
VLEAPVLEAPALAAPVLELPVPAEVPDLPEPVVETVEVDAAELVEPVLAAHPELRVARAPRPAGRTAPKRTRPGGRRAASRRTRVPSLPLLAGVAVLAISAGGALQAVHPALAGDADGRISPASALSGRSAVGTGGVLGNRGATVSRSADRTSSSDLQAAAAADAKQRDEALSVYASQAQKRADQIKLHRWVLPVQPGVYHLTARFGEYSYLWSSMHTGLDFAAPTGTPIMAVAGGTITEIGYSGAFGNRTIETLPDGTELWYCHQNEFGTEVGASVKPGQVIGYIGSTGNVTGPHLHLEVHPGGGDPVDPFTALQGHGLQP